MASGARTQENIAAEMVEAILTLLKAEERRRREGMRVGLGFVLLLAGVFAVLALGLLNAWEPTYTLIVAVVIGVALLVVGQAVGVLLAEFAWAFHRSDVAADMVARIAERVAEKHERATAADRRTAEAGEATVPSGRAEGG